MRPKKPLCVWFSRHEPTDEQRAALARYQIVVVNARPDWPDQAYWLILTAAKRCQREQPDLIVGVFPMRWLRRLLELVGDVPLIRPIMHYESGNRATQWTGRWERLRSIRIETETWQPGMMA